MSNSCSYIQASWNHFGYIKVARILCYLWNAVGIFVLICHPHNPKYVTHLFAESLLSKEQHPSIGF